MPIIVTGTGSTVQNIIDRAMRLIGQLEGGQSAGTNETADGLTALNAILDSWRNEKLVAFAIQQESIPIAATNATRTIGPSGDYVTTRPIRIESAYVAYSGVDIPVEVIEEAAWAAISTKTTTSTYPDRLWYQPFMPNGTINLYPVPDAASTLVIQTRVPMGSFASASDAIAMPPGWDEALAFNLAVDIAPEYGVEASPTVQGRARQSKAALKIANSRPIEADNELGELFGHSVTNILTGT